MADILPQLGMTGNPLDQNPYWVERALAVGVTAARELNIGAPAFSKKPAGSLFLKLF
jgi:hypothetical protein